MKRSASAEFRAALVGTALALSTAAACASGRGGSDSVRLAAPSAGLDAEAGAARAVAAAFLTAEAAGDPEADTLLATGADFVASGIQVTTRPRLAALNGPGTAGFETVGTHLAGGVAWVVAVYRFDARIQGLSDRGRATFVLEKQRAGWRIRHVHSSSVERW